jgi:hypothetical protein
MIALSNGFHALFPWGLVLGVAALALALFFPAWRRSALVLSSLALVCLAEPVTFVTTLWLVPAIFRQYAGAAEVFAWLGFGLIPLGMPALAMWLAYRRKRVVG